MKLTGYKRCPSCGMIFKDKNHTISKLSNPAPYCGATNETRELWPALDVLILIDIVEKTKFNESLHQWEAISTLRNMLQAVRP